MADPLKFPAGFLWGVATAAHQIEGHNVGSDWWWSETNGRVPHRSGQACGLWHRPDDEVHLVQQVGANAYRFSVEWARVEPEPGRYDRSALDRYRRLAEGLRGAGVEPFVTLHHFTNPVWLGRYGWWLGRETPRRFAAFAEQVGSALGDLVEWWVTVNEPNMAAALAYIWGRWPPHRPLRPVSYFRHQDGALVGHTLARQALQAIRPSSKAGIAFALWPFEPRCPSSPLDRLAASLLDRLFQGRLLARAAPRLDFVGVNYYSRNLVGLPLPRGGARTRFERSDFGWEVYPPGLYRVLRRVSALRKPVFVTENGIADDDDDQRTRYIVEHLRQAHRALVTGVDLRGYFHWSLLDNFEWAEGFTKRFGLFAVDFATQQCSPRPSAALYREIAAANALGEDLLTRFELR